MQSVALIGIVQTDGDIAGQLSRIADIQLVLTIATVVLTVLLVIAALLMIWLLFKARALMQEARGAAAGLGAKADPTLERVRTLVDDVGATVDDVRERVSDLTRTVAGFNDSLRSAGRGAEARVREFAAVLDVVRQEAEEVLLDTAATAHGIHTTAEALRAPRSDGHRPFKPVPPPTLPEEVGRTLHGKG